MFKASHNLFAELMLKLINIKIYLSKCYFFVLRKNSKQNVFLQNWIGKYLCYSVSTFYKNQLTHKNKRDIYNNTTTINARKNVGVNPIPEK